MKRPFRPLYILLLACLLPWSGQAAGKPADPLADFLRKLGYVRVPLKRDDRTNREYPGEGNYLYLEARVNGRKQKWLLDTGFSITCFDRPVGKRYKTLAEQGRQMEDRVLGKIDGTNFVTIDELQLGPMRLTNQPAQVKDLGNRWSYTSMDAILGMDLLRRHHAVVDFLGLGLFLRTEEPDGKTTKAFDDALRYSGWKAIPTEEYGYCNVVRGFIRAEPLRFMVDSGADYTRLDKVVAWRLGFKQEETGGTSRGIEDRAARSAFTFIPLVELPGFALTNQPVLVSDFTAWQPTGGRPLDGLIGADWLAAGQSVIDCQTGVLYLRPFPKPRR